ncbi:MAG: hypothetical protein ABIP50_03900 [Candidatus Saccharimonadales bacterium]
MTEQNEKNLEAKLVRRTNGLITDMVPTGEFHKDGREYYDSIEPEEFIMRDANKQPIIDQQTGKPKTETGYARRALSAEDLSVDNQIALMNERAAYDENINEETKPRAEISALTSAAEAPAAEPAPETGPVSLPEVAIPVEAKSEIEREEQLEKIGDEVLDIAEVDDPHDVVAEAPVETPQVPFEAVSADVVRGTMDMPQVEAPLEPETTGQSMAEIMGGEPSEAKSAPESTETAQTAEMQAMTDEAKRRVENIDQELDQVAMEHQERVDRLTSELNVLVGNGENGQDALGDTINRQRGKLRNIIAQIDSRDGGVETLRSAAKLLSEIQTSVQEASMAIQESEFHVEPLRKRSMEARVFAEDDAPYQLNSVRAGFFEEVNRRVGDGNEGGPIKDRLVDLTVATQNKADRLNDERGSMVMNGRLDNITAGLERSRSQTRNVLEIVRSIPDIGRNGINTQDLIAIDSILTQLGGSLGQLQEENVRLKAIPKPQVA